jgi:hypothetical protein
LVFLSVADALLTSLRLDLARGERTLIFFTEVAEERAETKKKIAAAKAKEERPYPDACERTIR